MSGQQADAGSGHPQDIRRADADGLWLTITELGHRRGISRASAARLVRRRKWPRQTDNHGTVRTLVPHIALERTDSPEDIQPRHPEDVLVTPAVLEAAIAAVRAAKDSEIVTLHELVEALQHSLTGAEARAEELRTEVSAARAKAEAAEAEAETLKAQWIAQQAKGRWVRAWAAWRGRVGEGTR